MSHNWENQVQMKTCKKEHPTHKQMRQYIPWDLPGRAVPALYH